MADERRDRKGGGGDQSRRGGYHGRGNCNVFSDIPDVTLVLLIGIRSQMFATGYDRPRINADGNVSRNEGGQLFGPLFLRDWVYWVGGSY